MFSARFTGLGRYRHRERCPKAESFLNKKKTDSQALAVIGTENNAIITTLRQICLRKIKIKDSQAVDTENNAVRIITLGDRRGAGREILGSTVKAIAGGDLGQASLYGNRIHLRGFVDGRGDDDAEREIERNTHTDTHTR